MIRYNRFLASFAFIALFVISSAELRNKRDVEEIPEIKPEKDCLAAGGQCVHESKCPADKINAGVECSRQKDLGAVCCHSSQLVGETSCDALNGECKESCPANLHATQAQDCRPDQKCCVLV